MDFPMDIPSDHGLRGQRDAVGFASTSEAMMMLNHKDSVRSGSPAYRRRQKPIVEVLILPI